MTATTAERLRRITAQLAAVAHDDDAESRFIYTALLVEQRRLSEAADA